MLGAVVLCGCSGSRPSAAAGTAEPAKGTGVSAAAASAASRVNLDEIFPAGRGRELLLNNCTTCHTFVPIVILQMTADAWDRNSRDHRERVTALSDEDFKTLYDYLKANFNPDHPVPKLPKELLSTWTGY